MTRRSFDKACEHQQQIPFPGERGARGSIANQHEGDSSSAFAPGFRGRVVHHTLSQTSFFPLFPLVSRSFCGQ